MQETKSQKLKFFWGRPTDPHFGFEILPISEVLRLASMLYSKCEATASSQLA